MQRFLQCGGNSQSKFSVRKKTILQHCHYLKLPLKKSPTIPTKKLFQLLSPLESNSLLDDLETEILLLARFQSTHTAPRMDSGRNTQVCRGSGRAKSRKIPRADLAAMGTQGLCGLTLDWGTARGEGWELPPQETPTNPSNPATDRGAASPPNPFIYFHAENAEVL